MISQRYSRRLIDDQWMGRGGGMPMTTNTVPFELKVVASFNLSLYQQGDGQN